MGADFEGAPVMVLVIMQYTNYIFTIVFLLEAILKLFAYGWSYF